MFSGSKYPKKKLFNFEKRNTDRRPLNMKKNHANHQCFEARSRTKACKQNDVTVLTEGGQLKHFFRIKHRIWYGDETRLRVLESV